MPAEPNDFEAHRHEKGSRAIVLLRGTVGANVAWRGWPELLSGAASLKGWDIHTLSLPASLTFDIIGILGNETSVAALARMLPQRLARPPFDGYSELALLAHSVAGLVAQRAILSDESLATRVTHLLLFGTPSGGIDRSSPFQFWKRQSRELARDSQLIKSLREDWRSRFGDQPPFSVTTVAGDRDELVPAESSLLPFPAEMRRVVSDSHWSIAEALNRDDGAFRVAVNALSARQKKPSTLDAARLSLEGRDFARVVEILWPQRDRLDEADAVNLAIALDSLDRRDDAIMVLGRFSGANALGVLAGRHKRRWLQQRRSSDADRALSLYSTALEKSVGGADWPNAFYAAINCAFMTLAYQGDSTACREYAVRARHFCQQAQEDFWALATLGEAAIYLGESTAARDAYAKALALKPSRLQFDSMYQQAMRAADLAGDDDLAGELATLLQLPSEEAAPDILYLDSIELDNIRCFTTLKVDLRPRGNLMRRVTILGDNARGKSTLLRAIAIGLCNASDAVALMKRTSGPFIRFGAEAGRIAVHLSAEPSGRRLTLEKHIARSPDGTETLRETPRATDFPWDRLFVCGYGTQRTAMATASFDAYSTRLAVSTLFDPSAVLQNPEVALLRQPPPLRRQLQKKLLDVMLLESGEETLDESSQGLQLRGPFGVSPFAVLSDGYRSTAQWLMDLFAWLILARRLPGSDEPGGILLIDEIEQHLHPRWQRHILQRLATQLPNMQIITTTHTPLVASAVADLEAACLLRFSTRAEGKTEAEVIEPERLHGKRADQVLTEVFELVTTRNPSSNRDLDELVRLRGLTTRTQDEERELGRLEAGLKEGLEFHQNDLERTVRSAIAGTLDKMVHEPPSQPFDAETKRQLRDLLGGPAR